MFFSLPQVFCWERVAQEQSYVLLYSCWTEDKLDSNYILLFELQRRIVREDGQGLPG